MTKINISPVHTISHSNYKNNVYRYRNTKVNIKKIKRKIAASNSPIFRIILYLIAFSLCLWQVSHCFDRYSAEPISANVDVDESFHNYSYPTVVVCPYGDHLFDYVVEKMKTYCYKNNASCSNWRTHHFGSETIVNFWKKNEIENCNSLIACNNAINQSCVDTISKGISVDTVQGRCFSFSNDNGYRFVSTHLSSFRLEFTNLTKQLQLSAQIFLPSKSIYKHNLEFTSLVTEYTNHVSFSKTIFYNVNSKLNPCWEEENVVNCMNSCMDRLLVKSKINCTMPFYENILVPVCSTYSEITEFKKNLYNIYQNRDKCFCKRSCFTTIYSTKIETGHSNRKQLGFSIAIPKTIVFESFAYPFSSLMAEVLSLVGFFLGLSMISTLDQIPHGVKKLFVIVRKMKHVFK